MSHLGYAVPMANCTHENEVPIPHVRQSAPLIVIVAQTGWLPTVTPVVLDYCPDCKTFPGRGTSRLSPTTEEWVSIEAKGYPRD